jgi:peptidoglycan/LPS O-acetylase OafA/YrhL
MKSDTIVLIVLLAAAATNVGLSIVAIWRARGFRRLLASLPLLGLLGIGLNILLGVSRDPSSHNLWPFEVLATCAAGIIYSFAFLGFQALSLRRRKPRA